MLQNYFKIAWRNLLRNKTFSLINITGLAIGLCCFLMIALYVLDELSYDRYNEKADRIFRINASIRFGGADLNFPLSSDMMGQVLKKDYPQVEAFTRIYNSNGNKFIRKGNEFINEYKVAHADSTLFSVFTLPAIAGNTKTALTEPNTVVITASMARKYFGSTDAVGKTIETNDNNKTLYKITAVIEDIPRNSHFDFDFFFSMKNVDYPWGTFLSHNFHTYLLLKKGTDYKAFEKKFVQYIDKYALPEAKQVMQINSMDDFNKAGNKIEYSFTPLTRIHLYSGLQYEFTPGGNIQYVYIFSAVALFILLLACINFMNLTTARSANRAREVGIRKVLGTEKKELVGQFLSESIFTVVLALAIGIALAYAVLPVFNDVSGKTMHFNNLFSAGLLPLLIALPFVVGLLAGSYPAFYLSAFKPIEVLKGKLRLGSKTGGLRNFLVVFQFTTSIILMIATVVVYKQLHYIQTKNLGFNKSQVLIVNDAGMLGAQTNAFKNEVLKLKGVQTGTLSSFLPVSSSSRNDNTYSKDPVMDAKNGFNMQVWTIDYEYLQTLGMQLKAGRNFSRGFGTDTAAVIINETTAGILGYADPIGKKIYNSFGNGGITTAFTIIGVVRNFNYESLKQHVGPLSFFLGKSNGLASFKVDAAAVPSLVKQIESTWKSIAPGTPFSYRFLDQAFSNMYEGEQRVGKIAIVFSILAIFIACLGLFGLATFITEQRTKEIGIRKVLGASVQGIIQLLSRDFLRLVAISFLIAAPVGWWAMHSWLNDFVYRAPISWWVFVMAGAMALFIALFTVSFQAIKAALANPVKSLRTE